MKSRMTSFFSLSLFCLISCFASLFLLNEDSLEEKRDTKKEIEILLESEGVRIEDSHIEKSYDEFNSNLVYKVYSEDTMYIILDEKELKIIAKIKGN